MYVEEVLFTPDGDLAVVVRPTWRTSRCGECGRQAPRYDRRHQRRWRHLSIGRIGVHLLYEPWRVSCRGCGVRTEKVPWAEHGSRFTYEFEEMAAYLAQVTDQTQVSRLLRIAWATVGSIVHRVVRRRLDPERMSQLRRIGVDEFSYRKRHRYLTLVVDHDARRVVWAAPGRRAETLHAFFDHLGEPGCEQLDLVTIDMAAGYLKAIQERLPRARVVFDRFHVQQLASAALDEVRRSIVREGCAGSARKAIKNLRYVLLKNPSKLSPSEHSRLSELQRTHQPLYRAYLLKETLAEALEQTNLDDAREVLRAWLAWASRSRLKPFVKAARTVRKYFDGILAYVDHRITNGLVEGLNAKLRLVARRAYGFHSHQALIAMLFLNCGGIVLDPPLPQPTQS
ncbi:MAG: ISL3 family transposase [Acidobacteria bacterium]|nr:MAG: ISL3 family transposase [Acidobacteriota bacterium]